MFSEGIRVEARRRPPDLAAVSSICEPFSSSPAYRRAGISPTHQSVIYHESMTEPEPMTLRQRQAAQTRQLLLSSAARVFARRGYSEATIDDVARDAGTSKGAVYHHFTSKQEIFRALLAERAAGLDSLQELAHDANTVTDIGHGLVELWLVRRGDHSEELKMSLEARLQAMRDPATAELLASYYRELRSALAELLEIAAQRFGRSRPRPHAEVIVFSLLDSIGQHWAMDPGQVDLDDVRAILTQTLTDLLG